MIDKLKAIFKNNLPVFVLRYLHSFGLYESFTPRRDNIKWGDLGSVIPFDSNFGYDRGGPIDRYYIENFLSNESESIKGTVLEIADNTYTAKFGAHRVIKSDVLHAIDGTPGATFTGDLSKADHLPSDYFDCIILTQTLQFIYDFHSAIKHCHRMLKTSGTLLITVPGISPIDRGGWGKFWLWAFNENSMNRIFQELFPLNNFEVKAFGNVFAATAFLYGAGIGEVEKDKLDVRDPAYDVIVTVKLTKL